MPDTLTMPEKYGGESYSLNDRVYPDKKKSRSLARRCLLLPFFRGNWSFTAFLGSFYLLLAWVMQSVSKHAAGGTAGESLLEKLSTAPQLEPIIKVLAHSPGSVAFILVLTGGLVAFSPFENALKKLLHGGAHALLQVGLFLAAMSAFAHLNLARLALNVDAPLQVLLFAAEMLVVGGVASATLFGLYLWLSNWLFRLHDNEVLLCQSNPDYKHFLRLKITADGKVRIFPVGVPRVGRFSLSLSRSARVLKGWLFKAGAVRGEPWFESADAPIESAAELIEEPITVPYPTQTGE
jgi:hypothetical protein